MKRRNRLALATLFCYSAQIISHVLCHSKQRLSAEVIQTILVILSTE
jgi:hypothetical protein